MTLAIAGRSVSSRFFVSVVCFVVKKNLRICFPSKNAGRISLNPRSNLPNCGEPPETQTAREFFRICQRSAGMASVGEQYGHLHDLHKQLKEIQDQLARGPRQIRARETRVGEAEAELASREQELKEARSTVDRKNLDLRSKEAHLQDLQGKLNTAASNREYDIIRGQMDADRAAKAVLEDEILEWLDRLDARQKDIATSKLAIKEAQQERERFATDFEQKATDLSRSEASLKTQIAEAEKMIPSELMPQYRRLVDAYGAEAMASAENGVCNQCFVALTAQNKVLLNSGTLLFCSVCGRLIYPVSREKMEPFHGEDAPRARLKRT
jgi:predicted  nucleic acid-binding Zn-ribbon protein